MHARAPDVRRVFDVFFDRGGNVRRGVLLFRFCTFRCYCFRSVLSIRRRPKGVINVRRGVTAGRRAVVTSVLSKGCGGAGGDFADVR